MTSQFTPRPEVPEPSLDTFSWLYDWLFSNSAHNSERLIPNEKSLFKIDSKIYLRARYLDMSHEIV